MTHTQYIAALRKLDLTPYGAAKYLGISIRQSHRYANGEQDVNETVARLIEQYLKHGLPKGK